MFAVQAKANLQAGGGDRKSGKVRSVLMNSTKPISTRSEVAKLAGVSEDTIRKVKVILAEATPELVEQVRSGEVSVNKAHEQVQTW